MLSRVNKCVTLLLVWALIVMDITMISQAHASGTSSAVKSTDVDKKEHWLDIGRKNKKNTAAVQRAGASTVSLLTSISLARSGWCLKTPLK